MKEKLKNLMKKKNTKISLIIGSIVLVLIAIFTTTYSLFYGESVAANPDEYSTGLLVITAISKSETISLDGALPMSDEDGANTEPYTFTIKNIGNLDYKFNIKLLSTGDVSSSIDTHYIKVKIDDNAPVTLYSLTNSIIKSNVVLSAQKSMDISIRAWLDINTPNSQIGKTFTSQIVTEGLAVYTSSNYDIPKFTGAETISNLFKANGTVTNNGSTYDVDTTHKLIDTSMMYKDIDGNVVVYKGDVNADGKLDDDDASLILEAFIGSQTFNSTQRALADVNGDGLINSGDSSLIRQSWDCGVISIPTSTEGASNYILDKKVNQEIRYYGQNPDNYIDIGDNVLWRIIGVFDGKLKLIRSTYITADNDTGLSWDTSENTLTTYDGYGINEWSQADLMKLLNPGYENNQDLNSSGSTIKVNNSLWYDHSSGDCYTGRSNAITSCNFTSTGLSDSVKDKIADTTWNTGGWNSNSVYPNLIYEKERGTTVISSPSDGITRTTSWTGKIGLAYPSDYGYATDLQECNQTLNNYSNAGTNNTYPCRGNNWMWRAMTGAITALSSGSKYAWLLTPDSSGGSSAWRVGTSGYVHDQYVSYAYAVSPVLYLKSDVKIGGGKGTQSNPYTLYEDASYSTLSRLNLSVDTTHTPDFSTCSGNSCTYSGDNSSGHGDETNGIYSAPDDLGISYYFRGAVENNYVSFAGKTWRIVRINGDGTIRMALNENLDRVPYNALEIEDNANVGYMYGTPRSSTFDATHANTNDSDIKAYLDSWYDSNLSSYSSYIADSIFCNDRSISDSSEFRGDATTNTGIGTAVTAYSGYKRTYVDHKPSLVCSRNKDKFTVSSSIGNGVLNKPIGLLTADEYIMAGAGPEDNNSRYTYKSGDGAFYLYDSNRMYWTMTPDGFYSWDYSSVFCIDRDGDIFSNLVFDDIPSVRPVVSLKSDAITGGSGTRDNPFTVG